MPYDLRTIKLPRLGDRALSSVVALLENGTTRRWLEPFMLRETGVYRLREASFRETPTFMPLHHPGRAPSPAAAKASLTVFQRLLESPDEASAGPLPSTLDFARAYRAGQTTPSRVAERVIAAIDASNSAPRPLRAVISSMDQDIRRQAAESEARLRKGRPLGPLDGVPVAIKDEIDALPYATTVGTQVYGQDASADHDATVVARLRAQGAVIIGKTNMHEIGIGVTGANTHHGHCHNPHNPDHYPGGSSSGSAAAVAAGLCPLAVAADGGGSVRIPAALCGVVGLKPTYGRVSEHGAFPLCWSVAHIGPIGMTVDDVALGYALMAGVDLLDPNTLDQPSLHLTDYLQPRLKDVRIGLYAPWFSHADREIVRNCHLAVEALRAQGATVVEVEIDDLELQRAAHAITISSEMLTAVQEEYLAQSSRFSPDTRLALGLARYFSNTDYLRAQRMRTRAIAIYEGVFQHIDLLITPTTGILAPRIHARDDESAEASLSTLTDLMRFAFPANLTGLPALTLPVEPAANGLPIGVQLMARPWQEHLLLRAGRAIESRFPRPRAAVSWNLLED